ncbi:MAG TPA: amidohydrolase [Candidatus Limnocylindrales bacterium]|nr:amidohydrolase [Candidatus Limnocylindrales bacterium]
MSQRPDLVVEGRIATLAGSSGFGWVEALGIAAGRVVAAGSVAEVDSLPGAGQARRRRLEPGDVAVPGLTDAHLHLAEGGLAADLLDLSTATLDEALADVARVDAGLPAGAWLEGHGWDVDRWGGWPTASALESAAPGRPVAIWAHDHHALWVSAAALALAGVDAGTPDPAGGVIRRATDGTPSGILHEAAARLVTSRIPPDTTDDYARQIAALAGRLVRLGVVAVHDPGGLSLQGGLGPAFDAYRRLADRGGLPLRVHACVREEQLDAAIEAGLRSGAALDGTGASRLTFGWLKLFADGTLGSRTAALLEPIEPEPDRPLPPGTERGVWMTPPEHLAELAARAAEHGIACQVHAIGDHAVRAALDALEPTVARAALVPRVEHVQLVDPADIGRFAGGGIAASVQPIHLRSDAPAARRLWGARAERSGYPWASLVGSGAIVAFGTDAPVEPIDPWPGLEMAVTRRSAGWPDGIDAFGPAEALDLATALRTQCLGGPLSARETDRGRLVPGARADLVVIPAAALAEPVEPGGSLGSTRPRLVLVDGQVAAEA